MKSIALEKLQEVVSERRISQVELARKSGVSRATIAKLLNGTALRVHERTAERLAKALGLPPEALDKNAVETAYLEAVAKLCRHLDSAALGIVSGRKPVPIADGFAPLSLEEKNADQDARRFGKRGDDTSSVTGTLSHHPRTRKPMKYTLQAATKRSRRSFLLGEPGAGKTTALRYLAWTNASGDNSDNPLIPILVCLARWAEQVREDREVTLIDAALSQVDIDDRETTREWLCEQCRVGNVLVLLDGLDEVGDTETQGIMLETIRRFVREHRQAALVITSRPVGFERPTLGARFDTYSVARLEINAIRCFVEQWCALQHGHRSDKTCTTCDESVEELRHAIVDNERIGTLAHNPMMLTILCLLYDAGAALPQRRFQLYEKIAEAFLFSWEQRKRAAMSGAPDRKLGLEDRDVLWILESIALELQKHDWTIAPRWWLLDRITTFLRDELAYRPDQARAAADTLLWSLQARSGVLVERGPEKYGFRHLAFQEYFAARAVLAKPDPIETLRPYLYHPRWREVVRLTAAGLDRRRAPQLLRIILDDPDPTGRILRRGLLLALGCLADGAPIHHAELLRHVERSVIDLGADKWFGIAHDAIDLLAELLATRLDEYARNAAEEMIQQALNSSKTGAWSLLVVSAAGKGLLPVSPEGTDSCPDEDVRPVTEMALGDGSEWIVLAEAPDEFKIPWAQRVERQLGSDDSVGVREACAQQLGRFAKSERSVRRALLKRLDEEHTASVRASIADALRFAASDPAAQRKLIEVLRQKKEKAEVRAACARALRSPAFEDEDVRRILLGYLEDGTSPVIRVGAVDGLTRCLSIVPDLQDKLFAMLKDEGLDDDLRVECLDALDDVLSSISGGIEAVSGFLALGSESRLAVAGATVLAEYAATERVPWMKLPIEKIEQLLVSIPEPYEHVLGALRSLVDAREVRRFGLSREKRIEKALAEHRERIQAMFIFGSSARGAQGADSDIDVMVIGDVTLKELTPALKRAEIELGRQVNAVLYTADEWNQRKDAGNPFVANVSNAEKVFVMGEADDLR